MSVIRRVQSNHTSTTCWQTTSNDTRKSSKKGSDKHTIALDRKISAELAPTHEVPDDRKGVNHDEKDGTEIKQSSDPQRVEVVDTPAPSIGTKESMVAEPVHLYEPRDTVVPGIAAANYGCTPSDGFRSRLKL